MTNCPKTYRIINSVICVYSSHLFTPSLTDPLSAVDVSITGRPAILDEAFTLQCGATGPVGSIQWWKNGSLIAPDNRTMFGNNNKTLTLKPVQFSDGGFYMCHVFNLVSDMTSGPFAVVVNCKNQIFGLYYSRRIKYNSVKRCLSPYRFNLFVLF